MTLKREGAALEHPAACVRIGEGRIGLDVIDDKRPIQPDLHLLAADRNVHHEPLVVGHELFIYIANTVQRSRLLAFEIAALSRRGVVHLNLESLLRPAGLLKTRVEENTGIALGAGQKFHIEFEVLEVPVTNSARVERVRTA